MTGRMDDDDEMTETHEINVTPFIDVVLVLLIVFMVAAPLATVDISVELPSSTAEPQPRPQEPVYLTLEQDLSLSLGNESIAEERLRRALAQATEGDFERTVYLRADRSVDYGQLMDLMNRLRGFGYTQIALVGQEQTP